jgi:hypothetical protein
MLIATAREQRPACLAKAAMGVGGMELDEGGNGHRRKCSRQRCQQASSPTMPPSPVCGESAAGAAGGWQMERRRFFSEATMAKIQEPEETFALTEHAPA